MSFWQTLRDKLKNPHWAVLAAVYVATVGAIVGTIVLVTNRQLEFPLNVVSYIVYVLAALLLGYSIFTIVVHLPEFRRKIVTALKSRKFTARLLEQYGFRTIVFAVGALIISMGNVAVYGVLGIIELSIWYGALAAYYLLLVIMRGSVLWFHRRKRKRETKENNDEQYNQTVIYRNCGIGLVVLPVCLSFAIIQMVRGNNSFEHAGMMIYVSAAYAFYKIIMSMKNFLKARKNEDMTVRTVRNVNLADALVSMLALETAMFKEFSPDADVGLYIGLTGAVVCALTVVIGIFMLISGTQKLKTYKQENTDERAG